MRQWGSTRSPSTTRFPTTTDEETTHVACLGAAAGTRRKRGGEMVLPKGTTFENGRLVGPVKQRSLDRAVREAYAPEKLPRDLPTERTRLTWPCTW